MTLEHTLSVCLVFLGAVVVEVFRAVENGGCACVSLMCAQAGCRAAIGGLRERQRRVTDQQGGVIPGRRWTARQSQTN
jgi:hypothetical protein